MDTEQIKEVLAHLKDEHATLGNAIASLERYLSIRASAASIGEPPRSARQASLLEPRAGARANPTAPKGTISIRKAIATVLKEGGRPMRTSEIWELAYQRGARTAAKRPEAVVALSALGIDHVKKVGPRTFQWVED